MDIPKLRQVEAFPAEVAGQKVVCLRDPLGFSDKALFLPYAAYFIVSLLDGNNSILDIQAEYMRRFRQLLFREKVEEIIEQLDANLFLENERFKKHKEKVGVEFLSSPIRQAFLAGKSYPLDPKGLKEELDGLFTAQEGPGLPSPKAGGPELKGAIIPHIDLARGGSSYAWGYKEIAERCPARLFVILGTCHSEMKQAFCATRKDFDTPLGLVPTDQPFLDLLEKELGPALFADEVAHRNEHSLEFQALFLKYIFGGEREIKIVPVLCSSFHDAMARRVVPLEIESIADFISSLKKAISARGEGVCLIASGDLSHVGPRFGDAEPVSQYQLRVLAQEDLSSVALMEKLDADGMFRQIAEERDRRKVCGLPPFYTLLKVIEAKEGKLLKYGQWPNSQGTVTFASLAFY